MALVGKAGHGTVGGLGHELRGFSHHIIQLLEYPIPAPAPAPAPAPPPARKWSKMVKNGQNGQIGLKWSKIVPNDPKW